MPETQPSGSIRIRRGADAPGQARGYVLEQLKGQIDAATASDAALIVSELVTNSVLHAEAELDQGMIVEFARLDGRLRLAVTDPGSSRVPHLLPLDPTTPRGFGLRLVDELSCDWGVLRHGDGMTCVWCELRLAPLSGG